LLLAVAAASPGVELPEQTRDGMTARLTVHVEDGGPQPGAAAVRLTVAMTGGPLLQVEPAQLSDALNAWEAERSQANTTADSSRTATEFIRLRQTKPGPAPLPDVKVRFRAGPDAPWQEAEWVDLLKAMRDAPPPETMPRSPPGPPWLVWAGAAAAVLALAAVGWGIVRRRKRAAKPLPPDRWAMQELARLDALSAGPTAYHTALSDVVRRYLAERFGLPATRQTTAEFLETVRRSKRLAGEQQALLRDFLERCDLAKFAPVGVSTDECREAANLARALVEQTAGTKATEYDEVQRG
jgi:hypothetical protein